MPNDATLGLSYLIRLPVRYNENSIYAYFVGEDTSHSIGGRACSDQHDDPTVSECK